MANYQQLALITQRQSDPTVFTSTVRVVEQGQCFRVLENGGRPLKTDAVFVNVRRRLPNVPLEIIFKIGHERQASMAGVTSSKTR